MPLAVEARSICPTVLYFDGSLPERVAIFLHSSQRVLDAETSVLGKCQFGCRHQEADRGVHVQRCCQGEDHPGGGEEEELCSSPQIGRTVLTFLFLKCRLIENKDTKELGILCFVQAADQGDLLSQFAVGNLYMQRYWQEKMKPGL